MNRRRSEDGLRSSENITTEGCLANRKGEARKSKLQSPPGETAAAKYYSGGRNNAGGGRCHVVVVPSESRLWFRILTTKEPTPQAAQVLAGPK